MRSVPWKLRHAPDTLIGNGAPGKLHQASLTRLGLYELAAIILILRLLARY
jgi:hypothetical protein